ncbi:MAG: hypothetical protein Q7W51_03035 [Coriobacteriia bacterium]|nr:hypothetical protein [Coriobacteriia bacterium]
MAKRGKKSKKGSRATPAKLVSLKRAPESKKRQVKEPKVAPEATPDAAAPETSLARISQLESDRTNLMAQVAWARGVAQEQQKALEVERQRAEKLATELEAQRTRVEQLKALTALDRLLGRHKRI